MFIQVDLTSSVAIYEQVVQQIKFSIAAGSILANELIPSVRELSRQLALNPNTVARAYRMLQDDGTVYARRGTGLAVAADSPDRCKAERRNWFENQFRRLIAEARRCSLQQDEIREIIESAVSHSNG